MACLTSSQLAEWQAFSAVEPFGQFRDELRNGLLISTMLNTKRDEKKMPKPFKPIEFMAFMEGHEGEEQETPEKISARMQSELFRVR